MGVENKTALHYAVYENKPEVVKLLLKFGADPNAKTTRLRTPLHIGCILGEDNLCKLLLNAGALINEQDFEMNTPVHYASLHSIIIFNE